jgi:NAD-dependent deacetylase
LHNSCAEKIAKLVREARRIAVLTGAGVSTPSGIPDFRSASGLYSDERNANVFDIAEFRRNPENYYRFAREFYPILMNAQPNATHNALARWERRGMDIQIATQNIDDLHQRTGSTCVYPVHGTYRTSTCQTCSKTCDTQSLVPDILRGKLPRCTCGGVFKQDITFFGEMLPEAAWNSAERAMSESDLVLILGTSLAVYPAAFLPGRRSSAAKLVIVNRDPTPLDGASDAVSHDDLADFMDSVDRFV